MGYKDKEGDVVVSISGKWISHTHTILAYCGFLGALIVGMNLHYHKIVQNEFYGYPQEWFPSVSATIGDRYPERSVFQIFIALTSGPRFALVALWYYLTAKPGSTLPKFVAFIGITRTLLCGGWVYITSTDDHNFHDIFMISYLVFTLPWTMGCLATSPMNPTAIKYRKIVASAFFGTLVPLIYYFIQHKVHRVPGAYTIYAFLEWSLILYDVAFDGITALDFSGFEFRLVDAQGITSGRKVQLAGAFNEKLKKEGNELPFEFDSVFSWSNALDTMSDAYLGFVFWSTLTSLGVTVWYFPLWHMGICGYEVIIMTTISPYLLNIGSVKRALTNSNQYFWLASFSGLIAFAATIPEIRLILTGVGVFFSCLVLSHSFSAERSGARAELRIASFSLGLIASTVAKFAFYSNNPIWPIMHAENGGWNKTGLFFALLAMLRSSGRRLGGADPAPSRSSSGSSVFAAVGLGGLIFALHSMLSDSSTMILWVWDGYPVKGPLAVPHGAVTILAMGVGFLIGMMREDVTRSWTLYGVGCVGAATLYRNHGWWGYFGALTLSIYLMAIVPSFLRSASAFPPARTFGSAFLIYNIMVLAHVWVVAYAFVPGGPLLRERTDLVLGITMALIGVGVFSTTGSARSLSKAKNDFGTKRRLRSYLTYTLAVLQIISIVIAYLRFPSYNYKPYHPDQKLVTAGIWTVHFALDNDMWSSETRMRDVIKELEIDVIGLLESDLQRIIMGNRDMTQFLAEDLGMYADFGPGPNKHTWGAALLSKFPIVNSTHHLLPSPVGELAPAIVATLDMYGTMVDVVVFHSGQEEDEEDRRLQSLGVSKLMGDSPRPLILLSYLVTNPLEGNYNNYVSEESRMKDIDPSDWDRWCEYILYRGLHRTGYARVSRSTITDTEIQLGKFVVGGKESTNEEIEEKDVPEGQRFPAMFYGEGVRGHAYHVFDKPRYFR